MPILSVPAAANDFRATRRLIDVVSIASTIRSLDRLETLVESLSECCLGLIRDSRQYTVEIDPATSLKYYTRLDNILGRVDRNSLPAADHRQIRSRLRGALRDYKREAERVLAELRNQLEDTAMALTELTTGLAMGSENQKRTLKTEIGTLRSLARGDDDAIRTGIIAVASRLEFAMEDLNRQNQLRVTQLSSEIRALQRRIEALSRPAVAAGDLRGAVEAALAAGTPFLLILVALGNLHAVRSVSGEAAAARAMEACLGRLRNCLMPAGVVGAWSGDVVGALSREDSQGAFELAKAIGGKLGGKYSFPEEGSQPCEIVLQVQTAVIQRSASDTPERIYKRIDDVLLAIRPGQT
jgi:GGDEF domain-containing protein